MEHIIGVIGIFIGSGGFVYGLYQRSQKKKLLLFTRSQAWYLYKKANRLLASIQNTDKSYNENNKNSSNLDIVKELSKSEAFGLEIVDETIRHIQLFESNFDSEIIQKWVNENKISVDHKHLFESLALDQVKKPKTNTA